MKDEKGTILYVGKAKELQTRLKQYFSKQDGRPSIPYLIAQVTSIDTLITLTEKEALLLENQLIKKHKPKYNILLKDDKSFISLLLTDHKWPMLRLVRTKGKPKGGGTYFGPYTSALAARQTFELLSRIFPLRQCSDLEFSSRSRPCLLYDIKRCLAPCVGKCQEDEYQTQVEGVKKFLRGKNREILSLLEQEIEKASEALEFEKAKEFLHTLEQLKKVLEIQHAEDRSLPDCDVLELHREGSSLLLVKLLFRDGRIGGSEHFSFHDIVSEDEEVFETFLLQHYASAPPPLLLLPCELENSHLLEEILSCKIVSPQKGRKKELLEMAKRNAESLFQREQDAKSLKEKLLLDLQETLQLSHFPRRIVCVDTSHLQGTHSVASVVSFLDGEKEREGRRLFRVKKSAIGDDYAALKEVLERYLTRAKEANTLPNLLIVDGGKGQLRIGQEVLLDLSIASLDLVAVSKEEARHDRGLTREKIFLLHQKEPLLIEERSPLLFLLQRIRDEAHKQAISYHRKKRSKALLTSELDTLAGIGPKKKELLLKHFGSVRALKRASSRQLGSVPGLTKRDRETLSAWIEREGKTE